jgi:hypothetical protein
MAKLPADLKERLSWKARQAGQMRKAGMVAPKESTTAEKKSSRGWKSRFLGKWRIVWMDQFDRKDIDMEVPAHITLENGARGNFQFILVSGAMDGEYRALDRWVCAFDFTWEGNDECDDASGDGWMGFVSDTRAEGEFRFHCGDTYKFKAVRNRMKPQGRVTGEKKPKTV